MEEIYSKYCCLPFDGVERQFTFTHLTGYGGRYYSYLWCKVGDCLFCRCCADGWVDSCCVWCLELALTMLSPDD